MENGTVAEQAYTTYKPLLFSLAYRMLGSVMDAEDIVQDAFLSLDAAGPEPIRNLKAYLCRVVTNRCIDRLRSAQKQREVYVGPWLPEPLLTDGDPSGNPPEQYMLQESVSTAYLLLLQQLSSTERAVFLLREVLLYDYEEIASIVGKSQANCRQIFHRAKRSIGGSASFDSGGDVCLAAPRPAAGQEARQLIEGFLTALATGDVPKLLSSLSEDASLFSDGGGRVTAAVRPILGADRIIRFLTGLLEKSPPGFSYRPALVGGGPGLVTYIHGEPSSVMSFEVAGGQIRAIYIVVNPEKLQHVR
ncbi:RNA polymerase sigma-70 factor [Paenibacillus caseinilyticus]|uniref:RNA polymerase sigma factor SigJ n=1 Tax=Paenibacillus mucilaginosus K02 TaxID=997761 RepID=I0BAV9_9BACL|nr:RNA polymerase sigma-70 factor [Paenibacillus mucilaginosus]AFH59506.1 RNA polymerase sigma factor SigJ [Paenibacillus mucilaginosus K02]